MAAKEIAENRFCEWLELNRMVSRDQALSFLTVVYKNIYKEKCEYAFVASHRHLVMAEQNGLIADENGFIHFPRTFEEIVSDHCTEDESLAIWFQIYLESLFPGLQFCVPFAQSRYETLLYITPDNEVCSVCSISEIDEEIYQYRERQLCPEINLSECMNVNVRKHIRPMVSELREIFITDDIGSVQQIISFDEQGHNLIKDRPIFLLDRSSIEGEVKIPSFICLNLNKEADQHEN